MSDTKEMTAPIASVGADAGQSLTESNISIADEDAEYKKKLLEIQRFCDPMHLNTLSMNDLFDCSFTSRPPLIDGLLYAGTYLLAGAPKIGKSFLVAQLAYHVSMGQTLWEYPVRQGGVLYLALEDDYQRLQGRMSRMFGVEGTDNLHFAITSAQIGLGLVENNLQHNLAIELTTLGVGDVSTVGTNRCISAGESEAHLHEIISPHHFGNYQSTIGEFLSVQYALQGCIVLRLGDVVQVIAEVQDNGLIFIGTQF